MQERDCQQPTATTGSQPAQPPPLDRLYAEHTLQLELCDALEFIADGLPDSVDRRLVREVVAILEHGMTAHFRFEEAVLFPLLRQRGGIEPALLAALDQLEAEHARDEDISGELVEELRVLAEQGRARNAEMLGYMLRGYFEGQRRHIEWENALVLPAAQRVLTSEDMAELASRLGSKPLRRSGLVVPTRFGNA